MDFVGVFVCFVLSFPRFSNNNLPILFLLSFGCVFGLLVKKTSLKSYPEESHSNKSESAGCPVNCSFLHTPQGSAHTYTHTHTYTHAHTHTHTHFIAPATQCFIHFDPCAEYTNLFKRLYCSQTNTLSGTTPGLVRSEVNQTSQSWSSAERRSSSVRTAGVAVQTNMNTNTIANTFSFKS